MNAMIPFSVKMPVEHGGRFKSALVSAVDRLRFNKQADYACEGTPEQCRGNPDCWLAVGLGTKRQVDRLRGLAIRADADFRVLEDGDTRWNAAVYYCGDPRKLAKPD